LVDSGTLILGVIFGSVGLGYFIYGKKKSNIVIRYTGVALIVYPYFIENKIALVVIGLVLMTIPKFWEL
jgi:hypothetical protein